MSVNDAFSFAPGRFFILVTNNRELNKPVMALARRKPREVHPSEIKAGQRPLPSPLTNVFERAIFFVDAKMAREWLDKAVVRKRGMSYHITPSGDSIPKRTVRKKKSEVTDQLALFS